MFVSMVSLKILISASILRDLVLNIEIIPDFWTSGFRICSIRQLCVYKQKNEKNWKRAKLQIKMDQRYVWKKQNL